jgi:hypothetical protein
VAGLHETLTEVIVGGAFTVIVALPDTFVYPPWAELATQLAAPTPDGVKTPAGVIVPPVAVQVTAELKAPVPATVAAQVAVCAVVIEAGVAVTETEVIVTAAVTDTLADPDLMESSVLFAVMVSDPDAGTVAGAVYSPELEIVPETADQVTVEL